MRMLLALRITAVTYWLTAYTIASTLHDRPGSGRRDSTSMNIIYLRDVLDQMLEKRRMAALALSYRLLKPLTRWKGC